MVFVDEGTFNKNSPRLSEVVPMEVSGTMMLTPLSGTLVTASITVPLSSLFCASVCKESNTQNENVANSFCFIQQKAFCLNPVKCENEIAGKR